MNPKDERKLVIKMDSSPLSPFSPALPKSQQRALKNVSNNVMHSTTLSEMDDNTSAAAALMKTPTIVLTNFVRETPTSCGEGAIIVEFPPGSMGLVLEPVIRSAEREIGCRVKDYYFGLNHMGIDAEKLQELVEIGDVVTFIGSRNVQSARFNDILDLLRSLKDAKRVITFKNISTSCTCLHCFFRRSRRSRSSINKGSTP